MKFPEWMVSPWTTNPISYSNRHICDPRMAVAKLKPNLVAANSDSILADERAGWMVILLLNFSDSISVNSYWSLQ